MRKRSIRSALWGLLPDAGQTYTLRFETSAGMQRAARAFGRYGYKVRSVASPNGLSVTLVPSQSYRVSVDEVGARA